MIKITLITICFLISLTSFSQKEKIKYRKLNYNDFTKYSINDTSAVIIDIFFDKKDNTAISQMSFLPITVAVAIISPPISAGLTLISFPLFVNGSYMLVKYRKKKLYKVLTEYKETGQLPKWVRKKANKQLDYYEMIKTEY
ncbi:MAG: hypothetical protein COB15_15075 [Flavobacteriales bacterium]|nr:MAG: hypothetical protein COB15_15075 [Flavobacteriales bacterium]